MLKVFLLFIAIFLFLDLNVVTKVYAQENTQVGCEEDENSGGIKRRRVTSSTTSGCSKEPPNAQTIDPAQSEPNVVETRRLTRAKEPTKNNNAPVQSPLTKPRLNDYQDSVPIPDRWRIVDSLGYEEHWYDPYNRNALKGDKPLWGDDLFFNLSLISDSTIEKRRIATPVGVASSNNPQSLNVFGEFDQSILVQNILMELVFYKGDTVFRPPDYEFRLIPVINYNYVEVDELQGVKVDPQDGLKRHDSHLALQGAFFDYHIRNVSDRYDFDSFRIGIQPFNSDFRGFLFQDNQLGLRFFGTRDNNIFQYNLAFFQRLEKDTNSGLNDVSAPLRKDYVFTANLFWQDLLVKGFISQFSVTYNENKESEEFFFDENGFIARPASIGLEKPRDYKVTYLGYSGDGHLGRLNLSTSLYYAFGETNNGVFKDEKIDINAGFFASELSFDMDWFRPKLSLLYASGDDDPYDTEANGFDAIFENPQFAGSDNSYWVRQNVPLIGGGRVALSARNGILNSLRSSKELGQSNFTNPGTGLIGIGFDADILPELRLSGNLNQLYFDDMAVIEAARNQAIDSKDIGQDLSFALIYRPFMTQNIVMRASYAKLFPGEAYEALFDEESSDYFLFNVVLSY